MKGAVSVVIAWAKSHTNNAVRIFWPFDNPSGSAFASLEGPITN